MTTKKKNGKRQDDQKFNTKESHELGYEVSLFDNEDRATVRSFIKKEIAEGRIKNMTNKGLREYVTAETGCIPIKDK